MKKTFAALLLIALISCSGIPDVPQIAPPPPVEPTEIEGLELEFQDLVPGWGYSSITFSNASTGFITTVAGNIIRTTDGGKTWTDLKIINYVRLNDVFFLNENEGWAVGGAPTCWIPNCTPRGAVVLHTTDGGTTWTEIKMNLTKRIELTAVWFLNSNVGFAVNDNLIIRTTDGGVTWDETTLDLYVSYDVSAMLLDVTFFDDQHGIASASAGRIVRTDDGGDTWTVTAPFNEIGVTAIAMATDDLVYGCGQQGMYRSSDYGKTWTKLVYPRLPVTTMAFISQHTGFAFGPGDYVGPPYKNLGSLFYTKDGGQTWNGATDIHEASMIVSAAFPTPQMGFGISSDRLVKITLK